MAQIKRNHRYGVSSKFEFGRWSHIVYGPFCIEENAQEWLKQDERDFREKELCSKTRAEKIAGKKNVRNAHKFEEHFRVVPEVCDYVANDYFGTFSGACAYAQELSEDLKTGVFLKWGEDLLEYFPYFN